MAHRFASFTPGKRASKFQHLRKFSGIGCAFYRFRKLTRLPVTYGTCDKRCTDPTCLTDSADGQASQAGQFPRLPRRLPKTWGNEEIDCTAKQVSSSSKCEV
jgi:hypothetical protein